MSMSKYIFTNKFKVGDEVICLRSRYPEAYIQPGEFGTVTKVEEDGYEVHKKGGKPNEICFEKENNIDFADIGRRQPEPQKPIKTKCSAPPKTQKPRG